MKEGTDDLDGIIRTRPSLSHVDSILSTSKSLYSLLPLRLPSLPQSLTYTISDSAADSNRLLICAHQVLKE